MKIQRYEHGGRLTFKTHILFMTTTHEIFHLEKRSLVQWNTMDIPTSYIWIIIFFDRAFEYGGGSKFWGYVGTKAESLCVEFYSFVQCRTFVKYLSCHC
jgi:hypothetical protein